MIQEAYLCIVLAVALTLGACGTDDSGEADLMDQGISDMSSTGRDMVQIDMHPVRDAGVSDVGRLDSEVDDAPLSDMQSTDAMIAMDASPDYPLDDTLRINHIQCKGTHNSYHVAPESSEIIMEWAYTHAPLDEQLDVYGVRQIELDVHYTAEGDFEVFHIPFVDQGSTCDLLEDCLQIIKTWSDANPQHHLLFILIEPKDQLDLEPIAGHYDELDAAIHSVWPLERILRPDNVRGDHPDLRTALSEDGWPTLGSTRQKAMFIMLDDGAHRAGYLEDHPVLEDRIIFMRNGRDESYGAILELNDAAEEQRIIDEGARAGYLVRSDADSPWLSDAENRARADAALRTGAHFISSDFPGPNDQRAFFFDIPDGQPSRCNPITAPPECTPADIESMP